MTVVKAWIRDRLTLSKESKGIFVLILLLFASIPFQRRLHGAMDSFSRKLVLPEIHLPEFFSRKIHLYITDPLIMILSLALLFRFRVSLKEFFWNGPAKYLTLLFFTAFISLFCSITASYTLQYLLLLQFSMAFLLFYSIVNLPNQLDRAALVNILAWVILTISSFECIIAILQYFHQGSLGLRFLGEPNISHFPFANPDKRRWLFDLWFASPLTSPYLYRSSGTFSHPNILGGFILCALMSCFYLFMKEESKFKRVIVLVAIPLHVFTFYIAYSRSAMIALAFSTLIWCALQCRALTERGFALKRFVVLSITMIATCLLGISLFYSQMTARGGIFNYNTVTQQADSERMQYIKVASNLIAEHPWFGVGFNNFQLYLDRFQPAPPGQALFTKVHNIYLLVASEMGLIGFGALLLFILSILKTASKAVFVSMNQETAFLFSVFLGLLLIGIFDFYLLNTQSGRLLFFGFAALLHATTKKLS